MSAERPAVLNTHACKPWHITIARTGGSIWVSEIVEMPAEISRQGSPQVPSESSIRCLLPTPSTYALLKSSSVGCGDCHESIST